MMEYCVKGRGSRLDFCIVIWKNCKNIILSEKGKKQNICLIQSFVEVEGSEG